MPDDPNSILDRLCIAFPACFDRKVPKPLKIGPGEERLARAGPGCAVRPQAPPRASGRRESDRSAGGHRRATPDRRIPQDGPVAARHPRRRRVKAGFPAVAC